MKKKLFITSKVYDTKKLTIAEIEREVQKDLDTLTERHVVNFQLNIISEKEVELIFHRSYDSSVSISADTNIINLDADIIVGVGLNGFHPPIIWYRVPFGYLFNFEIVEFERCYKRSAVKLGANRPKQIKTEAGADKVVLKLTF